jgi:hypothetical protein
MNVAEQGAHTCPELSWHRPSRDEVHQRHGAKRYLLAGVASQEVRGAKRYLLASTASQPSLPSTLSRLTFGQSSVLSVDLLISDQH